MSRIRTLKPEFWQDEKMAPLDPLTRLVFLGLISLADDAGRLVDNVKAIDGQLFPDTDDSARQALDTLAEIGRIERGLSASGQRIIQLVNWSKHQKIDKPNFKSALPEIALGDPSTTRRRSIPPKLRDAIYDRDGGVCQRCGCLTRRDKRDKYDSDPDLAEIDHIKQVIEGGTNDPQNLRLLCLGCNRKRAGEDVRRRNGEKSTTRRRKVDDTSALHTNDLGPRTKDRGPRTIDPPPSPAPVGAADVSPSCADAPSGPPTPGAGRSSAPPPEMPPSEPRSATEPRAPGDHRGQEEAADCQPPSAPTSWLAPIATRYEGVMGPGSFPWGQAGKALKPLAQHYAPSEIAAHLGAYLEQTEARFVNLAKFAQTFATWKPQPLVDEWGVLTEYGERVTRPRVA